MAMKFPSDCVLVLAELFFKTAIFLDINSTKYFHCYFISFFPNADSFYVDDLSYVGRIPVHT